MISWCFKYLNNWSPNYTPSVWAMCVVLGANFSQVPVLCNFTGLWWRWVCMSDNGSPLWVFCHFQRVMTYFQLAYFPKSIVFFEMRRDVKSNLKAILKCFFSSSHLSAAAVTSPWDGNLFSLFFGCTMTVLLHLLRYQQNLMHALSSCRA